MGTWYILVRRIAHGLINPRCRVRNNAGPRVALGTWGDGFLRLWLRFPSDARASILFSTCLVFRIA